MEARAFFFLSRGDVSTSGAVTPNRFYGRVFGLVTAAVLAWMLALILKPFASPLLWAFLLAFMLQPLNRKLLSKGRSPGLAAGLLTALTFLVVAGPISLFALVFVRQATDLLARFQAEAHDKKLPALELFLQFAPVKALLDKVSEFASLTEQEIIAAAENAAQNVLQEVASVGGSVLLGTFNVIANFGLAMFLLFFFLRDGKGMLERGVRLIPMAPARKEELGQTLGGVTRAVVLGTMVTALVQGTLVGVGFAIAGLPSPLVFGALGAVASLIPIVGTALVWLPAAISLFAQGQTGWAIFLIAWSAVLVGGSDNVVRPLIISGRSNASTLLVFVGLLGGVGVFGFAGIFMGPLILTLVATLLQYADQELTRASFVGHGAPASLPPAPAVVLSNDGPTLPASPLPETKAAPPSAPKLETKVDK